MKKWTLDAFALFSGTLYPCNYLSSSYIRNNFPLQLRLRQRQCTSATSRGRGCT